MTVAGLVIQTLPGRAEAVSARLASIPGLALHGRNGDRIAGTWSAADSQGLQRLAEELMDSDEDIVGIYPTLVHV
jgi:nitrate reductase NapAB chaperone NapD